MVMRQQGRIFALEDKAAAAEKVDPMYVNTVLVLLESSMGFSLKCFFLHLIVSLSLLNYFSLPCCV